MSRAKGIEPAHFPRRQPQQVEGAGEIDPHHPLEQLQVVRPRTADDALAGPDTGARGQDPRRTQGGENGANRSLTRGGIAYVTLDEDPVDLIGHHRPGSSVDVEHGDPGASFGEPAGCGLAQPETPPEMMTVW